MNNSRYISKKLQPFIKQQELLSEEYKKLQAEYVLEETLNDKYFDEMGIIERDYDGLVRQLQDYGKHHSEKQTGNTGQAQDMDTIIEQNVIETLGIYLLQKSKKEQLQSLQEREIEKKDIQQLTLLNQQNRKDLEKIEDEEIDLDEYGYYITLISEGNQIEIKIPATIRTFRELKSIVKSCFMQEENQIYYTDMMGNLLQEDMDVLEELYPPLYDLMKNYQPLVGIQIVKPRKMREQIQSLNDSATGEDMGLNLKRQLRSNAVVVKKKINWSNVLFYLNSVKYFFETILFIMVLALLSYVELDSQKFFTNTQLLQAFGNRIQVSASYSYPLPSIASIINNTLITSNDTNHPTNPLLTGLLIQTLVQEVTIYFNQENFTECDILNDNQRQLFIDKNQSCLNFDALYTNNLTGDFSENYPESTVYDSYQGGYVWKLNLTSQDDFTQNYNEIVATNWIKYNIKQTKFILNYYNSPSKRLIQVIFSTVFLFNDINLNYNSMTIQAFDLSKDTDDVVFYDEIILYLSIILLSSSLFDFFGLYFKGTKNNIIVLYLQMIELENRQKKLKAKKRDLVYTEKQELQQKQLILSEYFIINLKFLYFTIRIPLIFDIIYILSNVAILVRDTIRNQYSDVLDKIDIFSEEYQDAQQLIAPLFLVRIYTGILMLFLMASIVRFLGNWSPYLKCYGLVMIRFNRQSSFLLLVLIYIIGISAMAWSITIQGRLLGQDNFFYDFIGLLRCTLKYGMHNDLASLGLENNYLKDISFSFETRYIQYLIIIVISFIMVPIFISLMTEQVHNTKEEAKQKMLEMKKEEENEKQK